MKRHVSKKLMDNELRHFLQHGFLGYCENVYSTFAQESKTDEEKEADAIDRFFSSWTSCQALLAEYTLEELQEDARRAGIDHQGLSKRELTRKLIYKGKNL